MKLKTYNRLISALDLARLAALAVMLCAAIFALVILVLLGVGAWG